MLRLGYSRSRSKTDTTFKLGMQQTVIESAYYAKSILLVSVKIIPVATCVTLLCVKF